MKVINKRFRLSLCTVLILIIISTECTESSFMSKNYQEASLSKSVDSLMVNSRWNFEKICFENVGAQLLFNDSIKPLELYKRLFFEEGFLDTVIRQYNLLPDNGYLPGYSSSWDRGQYLHFRYELLLSQGEILDMLGTRKIELLRIVTRKYNLKYGQYIQPFFARASGACLTSRLLNNLKDPQFIQELNSNNKLQSILFLVEPIKNLEDSISYRKINQFAIDFLQSLN